MDNYCCGMPKSSWASPKAMRGKCERRGGSVNVAAAGTNVIRRAMGARRGRLSAPWLQFHGAGRADVYIIIRVRASRCGESALNPPPSPPIPRRRPSPAPHSDTPGPSIFSPPSRALPPAPAAQTHTLRLRDARLPTSQHIPRRRSAPAPAQRRALPEHFLTPSPRRRTPAGCAIHSSSKAFASPSVPLRAQKKRHRTVDVRCRMSRSTVVAVGHWGW